MTPLYMTIAAWKERGTKGPWRLQTGFRTVYALSAGDSGLTIAIAKVLHEQHDRAAVEANEQIITAAPALVAEVERLRAALRGFIETWEKPMTEESAAEFSTRFELARALLAEGEAKGR